MKRIFLLLWLISFSVARADLGPKPTMSFLLQFGQLKNLTLKSGDLMESAFSDGRKASPLSPYGPQRFECSQDRCHALAYGFADYHRLVLKFSDGKTRSSNIFKAQGMDSYYFVHVRANDLLVEPQTQAALAKKSRVRVSEPRR